MAFRYILTELRQGLRRNFSMHLALIITLLVSMSLAGVGYLLMKQSSNTRHDLESHLTVTVYLCPKDKNVAQDKCHGNVATPAQSNVVKRTLTSNPYVDVVTYRTSQQNFTEFKRQQPDLASNGIMTADRTPATFDIAMKDAHKLTLIVNSVKNLPGVMDVPNPQNLVEKIVSIIDAMRDVAAIFAAVLLVGALVLVANTVRLAAFARRREIGIMRLVGASSLYIMLPFLLEVLVTSLVGGALAVGALAAYQKFVVGQKLAPAMHWTQWTTWHDWTWGSIWVMVASTALAIIPALLMTRRYVKV